MIMKQRVGYECYGGRCCVKLSGGQRQRVAIARVFLKNAPILVLEEAPPWVDSDVEAAIQENLRKSMEKKTSIATVHCASTVAALGDLCAPVRMRQRGGFFSSEYSLAETRPAQ